MLNQISLAGIILVIDLFLRMFLCYRIVRRRLPVGVSWAWLSLILFLPLFGTFIYLNLGEYRMGRRRLRRLKATEEITHRLFERIDTGATLDASLPPPTLALAKAVEGFFESPLLPGNVARLLIDADHTFPVLIRDVDEARATCDMEFYIWSNGGRADEFADALIRAAGRGVRCRALVDQIGSDAFLSSDVATRLKTAGVEICAALPSGLIRSIFARPDLRIHRKIIIIDGRIAYTGSLNLADPVLFKRDAGVGQWVDAFCRLQGPVVRALALVFLTDWCVEKNLDFETEERRLHISDAHDQRPGQVKIQCLPSGPAVKNSSIEQVLIMAIYSAESELILTTPYFVPNEGMLYALVAAARKGVAVTLVVPAQVDSHLIQYASRAFLRDLVQAGVRVALYKDGMLHTKSVTIDGRFCLFGSLNLDPRSLRINFEISLLLYEVQFTNRLRALQLAYIERSEMLDLAMCDAQSWWTLMCEDLARLAGPVL